MAAIIEVHDLVKTYVTGDAFTHALKGVSLTVEEGEFLAIMGPSGSGKSTLMNLLGLLDTPTSGTYRIRGVDVSSLDDTELAEARAREIGFVFQSFNLLPRASIMRNVTLPLIYARTPSRQREEKAVAAMTAAGITPDLYYKHSNQISGGQMQRVAIARALVNSPALILADEPTGNLDTVTGDHILATFEKLRTEGHTIVLITHEPDVAAHADRIVHVRDGLITDDCRGRGRSMMIRDLLSETLLSLTANKGRSALTILGIVIGITSVIVMVAFGQGTKASITAEVSSMGANLLTITPGGSSGGGTAGGTGSNTKSLTTGDVSAISTQVRGVKSAAQVTQGSYTVSAESSNTNVTVTGTTTDYPAMRNTTVEYGSWFSAEQQSAAARVALLGPDTASTLFGTASSAVGERIRVSGQPFTVIGVTKSKGSSGFGNTDEAVYVPFETFEAHLSSASGISALYVEATTQEVMTQLEADTTELLLSRHRIDSPDDADFQIQNSADLASTISTITNMLTVLLGTIAGISLVVGGIGIMNMMLTTVTERIREIGLAQSPRRDPLGPDIAVPGRGGRPDARRRDAGNRSRLDDRLAHRRADFVRDGCEHVLRAAGSGCLDCYRHRVRVLPCAARCEARSHRGAALAVRTTGSPCDRSGAVGRARGSRSKRSALESRGGLEKDRPSTIRLAG